MTRATHRRITHTVTRISTVTTTPGSVISKTTGSLATTTNGDLGYPHIHKGVWITYWMGFLPLTYPWVSDRLECRCLLREGFLPKLRPFTIEPFENPNFSHLRLEHFKNPNFRHLRLEGFSTRLLRLNAYTTLITHW